MHANMFNRKTLLPVDFLCENDAAERNVETIDLCFMCDPPVVLNRKKPQTTLTHMAAHILFDP